MSSNDSFPLSRRQMMYRGALGAASIALAKLPITAFGATSEPADELIPFLEPQPIDPRKAGVHWDTLKEWITPADQFFAVNHYGMPEKLGEDYALEVHGLVEKPHRFTMDELKKLPKKTITATLECSGNGAGKTFIGAIGNATWGGVSLAALLKDRGISPDAVEVAFWGADKGTEDLKGAKYEQHFARALSIADVMREDLILAYEMNGQPLTAAHGAPLRLVVPGWYGIAWVKWLGRIEVRDHRLMTRFMAKDYVTLRGEELPDGSKAWEQSLVGPMNVKSIVAKVVRKKDGNLTIMGAAWSGLSPLKAVEVKIDEGDWLGAAIDDAHHEPFTWRFWTINWRNPVAGEHTVVSRAIDSKANIQPSADEPAIQLKKTYYEANQQWPRKIKI